MCVFTKTTSRKDNVNRFENKTTLITGGTSGIGLSGDERLIKEGAKVLITGRTEKHLNVASEKLGKML